MSSTGDCQREVLTVPPAHVWVCVCGCEQERKREKKVCVLSFCIYILLYECAFVCKEDVKESFFLLTFLVFFLSFLTALVFMSALGQTLSVKSSLELAYLIMFSLNFNSVCWVLTQMSRNKASGDVVLFLSLI